jgi:hypothetical protein
MAEPKTRKTKASVKEFLEGLSDENRRKDALAVCKLMTEVTKEQPAMWGPSIIGFGSKKLVYSSGRELDWPLLAFSPRKANTVLYLTLSGYAQYATLMQKLGKHKTGKSCLYINKLSDLDLTVLKTLLKRSLADAKSG